jgi:prolyl-tRNA synthetase
MEAIDGQEVLLPVVMPASLWQESGRYNSVGPELLRFTDRSDSPMLLGMTHEEAAVHLVREYGNSYSKYPFMVYQIQTKFRDEARPRAGLIRAREFIMKDAYSFHTSQDDLESYYMRCLRAYETIFTRVSLPEVITVASNPGMMGGNIAHEFMLLTPVGEDTIVICKICNYAANLEVSSRDNGIEFVGNESVCCQCGQSSLTISRSIEVGNVFQLGDKYSRAMGMSYLDDNGVLRYPVMGCYGIGVTRTAASVCQAHHDEHGPIWPIAIAPWQVHLCCVRADDAKAKALADEIYKHLQTKDIEVIYDDRPVTVGVMFSDADLLGIPIRVIISPRNIKEGYCEVLTRDKKYIEKVQIDSVTSTVCKMLEIIK